MVSLDRAPASYDFKVAREATTMRHRVTEAIRQAIAVGRYEAGDRMPERDLCELTGVSRTLVREALRQLESEGLVQVIPHKGPIVVRMTEAQARANYEVREVLEALAAKRFAENASDADMAALEAALQHVRNAYENGDVLARLEAKNEFYDCLVRGGKNEAIGLALHMINARTMLLRGHTLSMPNRWKESLVELTAMLDALRRRDPEDAHRLATAHVRKAAAAAVESFSDARPAAAG